MTAEAAVAQSSFYAPKIFCGSGDNISDHLLEMTSAMTNNVEYNKAANAPYARRPFILSQSRLI